MAKTNSTATITTSGIEIGDTPAIPLYAAEFHYWRNEQRYWRTILQRIKRAGFTVVTSFVQLNWHEVAPGRFDFRGRTSPQRDIPKLLELAKQVGLHAHLRIAPACCEWRQSGASSFKTDWKKCFDAFWRAVRPHELRRGGSLLLLQIHNEWFDLMGNYYGMRPYKANFDGFSCPPVPYWLELFGPAAHYAGAGYTFDLAFLSRHLRETYRTVSRLNSAWHAKYRSFADVVDELRAAGVENFDQYVTWLDRTFEQMSFPPTPVVRLQDHVAFLRNYMAYPLRTDVDHARKQASTLMTHNWAMEDEAEFNRKAHLDLSGYDLYQTVTAPPWRWTFLSADYNGNKLPFAGEFMCGTIERYLWGGQGVYRPNFARLSVLSHFACGLRAINLYMFVERDNWLQCPLDERGGRRPAYETFSKVFNTLRDERWHERHIRRDVLVLKHIPYTNLQGDAFELFTDRALDFNWLRDKLYRGFDPKKDFEQTFNVLHERSIDFVVARSVRNPHLRLSDFPVVVTQGMWFMDRDFAERLARYVRAGGHLLISPAIPTVDLLGRPLRAFRELALASEEKTRAESIRSPQGPLETFTFPAGKRYLNTLKSDGKICGYLASFGKGKVAVFGFPINRNPDLFETVLLEWLGAKKYVDTGHALSDGAIATLDGEDPVAIVFNGDPRKPVRSLDVDASVLSPAGRYHAVDLLTGKLADTFTVRRQDRNVKLRVNVPARDATVIKLCRSRPRITPGHKPKTIATIDRWQMRCERIDDYLDDYASAARGRGWVRVPVKDWTLPAIAHGSVLGVQGWFWLKNTIRIPKGKMPVYLRVRPHGWHNILVFYVNGQDVGRVYVERPGAESQFEITRAVRRGALNSLAVRLYRQSLDCHDRGESGFELLTIESGPWQHQIEELWLKQERLDHGESQGWHKPGRQQPGWSRVSLPIEQPLALNQEIAWLRATVTGDLAHASHVALAGRNLTAQVFVNGQYLAKTPHLPVELPLDRKLPPGRNTIALRLAPDNQTWYTLPRDHRFNSWIRRGLLPLETELSAVNLLG